MKWKPIFNENGEPLRLKIWDAGPDVYDRYTVVFTHKKGYANQYLGMAFYGTLCGWGEFNCKPGKHLGKRVQFIDLHEASRERLKRLYKEIWNL